MADVCFLEHLENVLPIFLAKCSAILRKYRPWALTTFVPGLLCPSVMRLIPNTRDVELLSDLIQPLYKYRHKN